MIPWQRKSVLLASNAHKANGQQFGRCRARLKCKSKLAFDTMVRIIMVIMFCNFIGTKSYAIALVFGTIVKSKMLHELVYTRTTLWRPFEKAVKLRYLVMAKIGKTIPVFCFGSHFSTSRTLIARHNRIDTGRPAAELNSNSITNC